MEKQTREQYQKQFYLKNKETLNITRLIAYYAKKSGVFKVDIDEMIKTYGSLETLKKLKIGYLEEKINEMN
jgi:hypothetical protein